MREVKFRGKRVDGKGWIEGFYFRSWGRCFMAWGTTNGKADITEVDPATVGRFTGMLDVDGREIYEGDILKTENGLQAVMFGEHHISCCGCCYDRHQSVGFYMAWKDQMPSAEDNEWESENLTVIGDIHSNPELLEA